LVARSCLTAPKTRKIGCIVEYLTAVGSDLKEVGVVGDEETAILNAPKALRHRCTYVFTTGGIGPTQGDITADYADQHRSARARHPARMGEDDRRRDEPMRACA
jgi:molybdopterin-biosynthesis enzyme MoeA-like protein